MRDNIWLQERLQYVWNTVFSDVEKKNTVVARFRGKWKNKCGHIRRLKNMDTEIVVNALFSYRIVPEELIDATIAHELVHYMHGFQSPHPRCYKHPHAGGIVTRELKKRGLGKLVAFEKEFLKKEWKTIHRQLVEEQQQLGLQEFSLPSKV